MPFAVKSRRSAGETLQTLLLNPSQGDADQILYRRHTRGPARNTLRHRVWRGFAPTPRWFPTGCRKRAPSWAQQAPVDSNLHPLRGLPPPGNAPVAPGILQSETEAVRDYRCRERRFDPMTEKLLDRHSTFDRPDPFPPGYGGEDLRAVGGPERIPGFPTRSNPLETNVGRPRKGRYGPMCPVTGLGEVPDKPQGSKSGKGGS